MSGLVVISLYSAAQTYKETGLHLCGVVVRPELGNELGRIFCSIDGQRFGDYLRAHILRLSK